MAGGRPGGSSGRGGRSEWRWFPGSGHIAAWLLVSCLAMLFGKTVCAGEDVQGSGSAVDTVTVLPFVTVGLDRTAAAGLSDTIVRLLGTYPGLEVRVHVPDPPLDRACLGSVGCLHALGTRLGTAHLLLGLARQQEGRITLTLILFDVGAALPVQRVSVDLPGDAGRFARVLRPIIHEIAMSAGGGSSPGESEGIEAGEVDVAVRSTGEADVAGEEPSPTSLDDLLDIPASGPPPSPVVSVSVAGDQGAAPTPPPSSREAASYGEDGGTGEPLSDRERVRQEKKRRKAMARRAREENRRREKERRELERRREAELKAAARAAEERRKQEVLEAKARQREVERRRKEESRRRAINVKRARKGLPPLPEPEPAPAEPRAASSLAEHATTGSSSSAEGSSTPSSLENASGTATSSASLIAGMGGEPEAPLFLENDGPWQVGTFGGLSYFVGFGLLGTGIEIAYSRLPWLWLEGAFESLHAKNPDTARWFYLVTTRFGAVVRKEAGPLHPYGGIDGVALLFGPSAWAWGGTARTGLDIMVGRGIGFRIELAAGALHSKTLTDQIYQYPDATGLFVRFGLGVRYHF